MTKRIIIVGAGHNGLVCAAYLARAGREVLVFEANAQVGGAAVTRTFAPGYQVPAVAHLLYGFDPAIERELQLRQHGFTDCYDTEASLHDWLETMQKNRLLPR